VTVLLPCTIVTLLRYDSIELKELLTYLLTYLSPCKQFVTSPVLILQFMRNAFVYHKCSCQTTTSKICIQLWLLNVYYDPI